MSEAGFIDLGGYYFNETIIAILFLSIEYNCAEIIREYVKMVF